MLENLVVMIADRRCVYVDSTSTDICWLANISLQLLREQSSFRCYSMLAGIFSYLQPNPSRIAFVLLTLIPLSCIFADLYFWTRWFSFVIAVNGIHESGLLGSGTPSTGQKYFSKAMLTETVWAHGYRTVSTSVKIVREFHFMGLIFVDLIFMGLIFVNCNHHGN